MATGWHYGDMRTAVHIASPNTETGITADCTFMGIRKGGHGWLALRGAAGAKVFDFNTPKNVGPNKTVNIPNVTGFVTSNQLGITNNRNHLIFTVRDDGAAVADVFEHVSFAGVKIAQFAASDAISKHLRACVYLNHDIYCISEPVSPGLTYQVRVYSMAGVFIRNFNLTLGNVYVGITTDGHNLILVAGLTAATANHSEKWSVTGTLIDASIIAAATNYRGGVSFHSHYLIQKQF